MKKLLVLLSFVFCLVQFSQAMVCQEDEVDEVSVSASGNMSMDGPTSLTLDSNGYVGHEYDVSNVPSNAELRWSIQGRRAYLYPNGTICSVSIYEAGSYRLVCDAYVNGVWVDSATIYITVMPYRN